MNKHQFEDKWLKFLSKLLTHKELTELKKDLEDVCDHEYEKGREHEYDQR